MTQWQLFAVLAARQILPHLLPPMVYLQGKLKLSFFCHNSWKSLVDHSIAKLPNFAVFDCGFQQQHQLPRNWDRLFNSYRKSIFLYNLRTQAPPRSWVWFPNQRPLFIWIFIISVLLRLAPERQYPILDKSPRYEHYDSRTRVTDAFANSNRLSI